MDFTIESKRSVGGRIASNAGLLFGAKSLGAALGFVTLIITAQALDNPTEFGVVILLHGYMLFFAEMMTFQPWQSIIRFGSDDIERADGARLAQLVKFAAILDAVAVVLAYLAAVSLFGLFVALATRFPGISPVFQQVDPDRLFKLIAAYSSVVLFQQIGMSTGILRLFDRFRGLAAAWLVMPVVRFAGAVFAASQGWGLLGFVAVWYLGALSRYLVVIGLGLAELSRRGILRPALVAKVSLRHPRDGLWPFASKAYVESSLAAGFTHLPLLLVTVVFGPAFAAIYKIAEEVARLLSEGVKLLDQVIYPELARIVAAGEGGKMMRLVTRASFVAIGVGVFLSGVVYFFGPSLVERFLSEDYAASVELAVLLVIGAAIFAAVAPLYPVFYAVGRPERAIYARLTGIIAYIIGFALLTRRLGEIGTAWAWIVGYAAALVVTVWLVRRTLEGYAS